MGIRITQNMLNQNMLNNLYKSYRQMDTYQDQLSSGKRINRPSDDPIGAVRAMFYRSTVMETQRYVQNAEQGLSWMEVTDDSLDDVTNVIHRVRELTVQAANGTNSQSSLEAIRAEIIQLNAHLGEVANTTIAGEYVFGGNNTVAKPFPFGDEKPRIAVVAGSEKAIPSMASNHSFPSWGGNKLIYSADNGAGSTNLYLNEGNETQLLVEGAKQAVLNANGSQIAYISNNMDGSKSITVGNIVKVEGANQILDQKEIKLPSTVTIDDQSMVTWSPDGNHLYVTTNNGNELKKVPVNDPTNLMDIPIGSTISSLSVSPDGSKIVYGSSDELLLMDLDGSSAPRSLGPGKDPSFSPDGSKIAYSDGTDIFIMNREGQESIKITQNLSGQGLNNLSPTWSSDGKSLAFQSIDPDFPDQASIYTLKIADIASIPTETGRGNYININVFGRDVFKHRTGIFSVLDKIATDLADGKNVNNYLTDLDEQLNNILQERASLGARMKRMELTVSRLAKMEDTTKRLLSGAEDADIAKVITDLKNQENVHRAALSAGARIIQPSLLDFLR